MAKLLSVCEDTIVGWEVRNIKPSVKQMPDIIRLIGYLPIEIDTAFFGGRITMYRYENGLTPKEVGELVGVDATTVRAWEGRKNTPNKKRMKSIEHILGLNRGEKKRVGEIKI